MKRRRGRDWGWRSLATWHSFMRGRSRWRTRRWVDCGRGCGCRIERWRGGFAARVANSRKSRSLTAFGMTVRGGDASINEKLLGDDAVGPLDHGDEDGGRAEFGVPGGEVGFGDAAGAGADAASEDGDVF